MVAIMPQEDSLDKVNSFRARKMTMTEQTSQIVSSKLFKLSRPVARHFSYMQPMFDFFGFQMRHGPIEDSKFWGGSSLTVAAFENRLLVIKVRFY